MKTSLGANSNPSIIKSFINNNDQDIIKSFSSPEEMVAKLEDNLEKGLIDIEQFEKAVNVIDPTFFDKE